MINDLVVVTKRLEEQLKRIENGLSRNMRRVHKMESQALLQIREMRGEVSNLSTSRNWMTKLLHTIDSLGEIEKFLNKLENIGNFSDDVGVEEVSLEGLMECNARLPF